MRGENKERILQLIDAELFFTPEIIKAKMIEFMLRIAGDSRYGYDQEGPRFNDRNVLGNFDYDCSSLVISSIEYAGIENIGKNNGREATNTYTMPDWLKSHGFKEFIFENDKISEADLEPGDVLWCTKHTAIFYEMSDTNEFRIIDASRNERIDEDPNGELSISYHFGEDGDQLQDRLVSQHLNNDLEHNPAYGGEIGVRDKSDLNRFTRVYRYVGVENEE